MKVKFIIKLSVFSAFFLLIREPILSQQNDEVYSYLALGDSYTIGESVAEEYQWPRQLRDSMNAAGVTLSEPIIIAKTGWRTDDMLNAAQKNLEDNEYDLVSLLIGVNNEYQGRSPKSFKPEFEKCLKYAIEHAKSGNKGVFVLSIPDYGYTPFGAAKQKKISKRLDKYNRICKELCAEYEVLFINITDISRKAPEDPDLVAADGLHPSDKQYALWVRRALPEVSRLMLRK